MLKVGKDGHKMAKTSQAKMAANARYDDKAYDKFLVRVPKGQKAAIQAAAEQVGESINGYVNKAVQARMGLEEWPEAQPEE